LENALPWRRVTVVLHHRFALATARLFVVPQPLSRIVDLHVRSLETRGAPPSDGTARAGDMIRTPQAMMTRFLIVFVYDIFFPFFGLY
jgi:hypothetical protein